MEKDRVRKKFENGRWLVWTGEEYQLLEDIPEFTRPTAYDFLSGNNLRSELEYTTEKSKRLAALGDYPAARKLAVVADELEELMKNGGDKHG